MSLQVAYAKVLLGVETLFIHLLVCFVGESDDFVKVFFCEKIPLGVEPKQSLDLGVWSLHKVVKAKKNSRGRPLVSPNGLSCFLFFIYFIFSTLPTIFLSFWVFLANALGGNSIKECYHCHCHNHKCRPTP